MSINSSLVKLADKIDVDGKSTISPEYKNPNNSIEKSIERIAENYNGSGGTGGGVLEATITVDEQARTLTLDKTYNDIIAAPFTVIKIYGETTVDFAFVSFATHSNVTWSVDVLRIAEGNIKTMMFAAESPDAPLVCYLD